MGCFAGAARLAKYCIVIGRGYLSQHQVCQLLVPLLGRINRHHASETAEASLYNAKCFVFVVVSLPCGIRSRKGSVLIESNKKIEEIPNRIPRFDDLNGVVGRCSAEMYEVQFR